METNKPLDDCYMDLKRLSAYASISVRTLRDYLNDTDNPIPSFTIKRKILVRKSEFDQWIEGFRTSTQKDKIDKIVNEVFKDFQIKK